MEWLQSKLLTLKFSKKKEHKPDVLKVTEYILNHNENGQRFSIGNAAKSQDLNGISVYRIAEIMGDICLDPNGPNSLTENTIISSDNRHFQQWDWQLNSTAYFSYLSYLSVKESEKSNHLALKTLWVAIFTIIASVLVPLIAA